MVRICSSEIVEKILKIIKRYCFHNNYYDLKFTVKNKNIDYNNMEYSQNSIKERIAQLIKENEKYFVYEVMRTTADTILYDSRCDIERLKTLGYAHRISVEIFEKYGIFLYATDLSTYIYAPIAVKYELQTLINEYGLDKVAEEIAIYLKENHSNQFGISIICTP